MSGRQHAQHLAVNAIRNKDMKRLSEALKSGCSTSHSIYLGPPISRSVDLLEYCVLNDFTRGIDFILGMQVGDGINRQLALEAACKQPNEVLQDALLDEILRRGKGCTTALAALLINGLVDKANEFASDPSFNTLDHDCELSAKILHCDRGRYGQSPLHVAAALNSRRTVDILVKRGISVDVVDTLGYTPLFVACSAGAHDSTIRLLQHGASPNYGTAEEIYKRDIPRSPLFALCHVSEDVNQNERLLKILKAAGLKLERETWLNLPEYQGRPLYVKDLTYKQLKDDQKNASKLLSLGISVIRDQLKLVSKGNSSKELYKQLPLSNDARNYLTLIDELDDRASSCKTDEDLQPVAPPVAPADEETLESAEDAKETGEPPAKRRP